MSDNNLTNHNSYFTFILSKRKAHNINKLVILLWNINIIQYSY